MMVNNGDVWQLSHDGKPVANLIVTGSDWPWVHGRVEQLAGFDEVRDVFAADAEALNAEDIDAIDAAYEQVRKYTKLAFPDGTTVAEYWLHVFGDGTCGWRWHDEPFDE